MALANLRMLTRVAVHVGNVTTTYEADEVVELDDAELHLVERGLAVVVTPV